ncbi:class I SAM-dependent methyltransferase [Streptomyces fructofermentans]|uniref:Methyltransferase n=1 Tax=Streptomyces fructofermentans TaxID=152141 RepID=A0A918N7M6_9ACTN|nr:class I SAM-dependent methyltransferase [Streptomyces fructofermentans]GGX44655.1 methyltransferase [Streptomyces fructofermentans]
MDTSTYKSEVAAAFNSAAASYDRLGVEFFTPMGRRLVERAAPGDGARVLDVGCGRGACVFPAAELVGPKGRVVGIDVAEAMIEEATKEAGLRDAANVELRVMDGEHPDFAPRSFDVVMGSYSVIFLPDAPAALARYAPLLSPGGRLAFTSPVFSDDTFPFLPPVFTELIPRELLLDLPPQWQPEQLQKRFNSWLADPADLARTLEDCGFEAVTVVDEPVRLVAESGLAWVDWSHTQGMRLLWNHLAADKRLQLRERLISSLDAMRDGDGPLTIDTPVRYVTASTPN